MQFLFYNDSSRSQVALEKLICMTRDVANTVSEVYVTSVELLDFYVKVFFSCSTLSRSSTPSVLRQTRLAVCYVALQPLLIRLPRSPQGRASAERRSFEQRVGWWTLIQCVLNFNLIRADHITESLRSATNSSP